MKLVVQSKIFVVFAAVFSHKLTIFFQNVVLHVSVLLPKASELSQG